LYKILKNKAARRGLPLWAIVGVGVGVASCWSKLSLHA